MLNTFFLTSLIIATLVFAVWFGFHFHLTLFALAGLSLGALSLSLAFIVFFYAKQKVHHLWALFITFVALWGFGTAWAGVATNSADAIQHWKITYVLCSFLCITFYHLICVFCSIERRKFIVLAYAFGVLFLPFICFSSYFINSTIFIFNSIYYHVATPLFDLWVIIFVSYAFFAFWELYRFIRISQGIRRLQALYFFWSMALGWAGGLSTLLPPYHIIVIYPAWHFTICIYTFMMSYAIFRYQYLDISIAVTRVGIFAVIYSLVLGIPFGLVFWQKKWLMHIAGENWYWIPMVAVAVLATVGPSVYLYIQKRAEDRLLREQHRYQATLRQASAEMGKIKDLKQLLNMIVDVLTDAIQIEHALVYIYDEYRKEYILEAFKRKSGQEQFVENIAKSSPLVEYLSKDRNPLVFEEINQKAQNYKDLPLEQIAESIASLGGALVVPIFIDQKLIGMIVMGKKESGKIYTEDDIAVLGILANQTALAVENCMYMQTEKERIKKETELMRSNRELEQFAYVASHDLQEPLRMVASFCKKLDDSCRDRLDDNEKEYINYAVDGAKRMQSLVDSLLKYARTGKKQEEISEVDLNKVLQTVIHDLNFTIKESGATIKPGKLPVVMANQVQMTQLFQNLLSNALKFKGERKPVIEVSAQRQGEGWEFEVKDNGIGIDEQYFQKLFVLFQRVHEQGGYPGTGIGLALCKRIVENLGGKIWVTSKVEMGTTFHFILK